MQNITVNDQSRDYKTAVGLFLNEVAKGTALAFSAQLTPSTNVPESGTTTLLKKKTGGSGMLGGQQRMADTHNQTETHPTRRYNMSINVSMSEDGDVTHLGDMLMANATYLTANSCAKLQELFTGVLDG
jgi:hypothetical protein